MGIFTGKTAIITGGGKAKSIGYGIATAYAKEGANLVLTGRNEQKLIDAKEELENSMVLMSLLFRQMSTQIRNQNNQ